MQCGPIQRCAGWQCWHLRRCRSLKRRWPGWLQQDTANSKQWVCSTASPYTFSLLQHAVPLQLWLNDQFGECLPTHFVLSNHSTTWLERVWIRFSQNWNIPAMCLYESILIFILCQTTDKDAYLCNAFVFWLSYVSRLFPPRLFLL